MTRLLALLALSLGLAPYQCGHPPDPDRRREETPGEALYALAQDFRAKGDDKSYRSTLSFLIQRYPSSHFAVAARADLAGDAAAP